MILPLDQTDLSFSPSDREILSHHWYPVAFCHELKGEPMAVTLLNEKLVLYRHSQGVTAARDVCLHRGVPLSMGWMEGDQLVCKYHGFHYGPSGQCTKIPAQPGVIAPPKLCLTTFPVIERYGLIWTCLAPVGDPVLPDFHEWDDPDYVRVLPDPINIRAAAGRQLEGFLDVAHFAWIHTETFGDRTNPIVPRYDVVTQANGLRAEYASSVSNFTHDMRHRAPGGFSLVAHL